MLAHRWRGPGRLLSVLTLVAGVALSGCTAPPPPSSSPSTNISSAGQPTGGPSLTVSPPGSPGGGGSAPPVQGQLFKGQTLVYAQHGFTPSEVAAIAARLGAPVTAVFSSEGQLVTARPDSFVPIATMFADPAAYATAVGRPELAAQLAGGLVLASAEARLRHAVVGDVLQFAGKVRLPVTAIVDDHVIGGYEMATGNVVLRPSARQPATYLLIGGTLPLADATRGVLAVLPARSVRVETDTANGYFSGADRVLTQLRVKQLFGEFAIRHLRGGAVATSPAWEQSHIGDHRIQQLGVVTCNKAIVRDLAAAMAEVTRRKLGATVHTADFQYEGGCYNPRVQRFADDARLSAHTWGIAVDINVDVNPLGAKPRQDPRLVAIMTAHNFTWGGRWLRPDGAHFEWVGPFVRH